MGEGGNDTIFGGAGEDSLYGSGSNSAGNTQDNDYLDGGSGKDVIYGGGGDDIIIGGQGGDTLYGEVGKDTYIYNRGDGEDTIEDYIGEANILRFGTDISSSDLTLRRGSLLLDLGNGDKIHLKNNDTSGLLGDFNGNDVFSSAIISSFQFADGSTLSYAELLARGFDLDGTAGDDIIYGTNITDRINGLGGNDTLLGGYGDDTLYGKAGTDTLQGGGGNDYLDGGMGDDLLEGDAGANTYSLKLGDGHDKIITTSGLDGIVFGAGIAASSVLVSRTAEGLRLQYGNVGDEVVLVGDLRDLRFADGSRLTLAQQITAQGGYIGVGGSGDDFLTDTSLQAKIFYGGQGDDVLMGGGNNTTYYFDLGDGQDSLVDLGGVDTLSFGNGISVDDIWFSDVASNSISTLKINYGDSDAITVLGGSQGSIENFNFADGAVLSFEEMSDRLNFEKSPALAGGLSMIVDWGIPRDPGLILGTEINDHIYSSDEGDDIYVAGKGDDLIMIENNDGEKQSKFLFNLGDGTDELFVVLDNTIIFGAGIDPGTLRFTPLITDYVWQSYQGWGRLRGVLSTSTTIYYGNQGDSLIIHGQNGHRPVDRFEFADGQQYSFSQMSSLVPWFSRAPDVVTSGGRGSVYTYNLGDAGSGSVVSGGGGGGGGELNSGTPGLGNSVVIGGRNSGESIYNTIQFGLGIDPSMLSLGKGSLLIRIGDNGDEIHLTDFNPNDAYSAHTIQDFLFADGTRLTYNELIDRGFDLQGGATDAVISGTSTSDRINGGTGNDTLAGGAGDDVLVGGFGDDVYFFGPGDGVDRIYEHDLNANIDTVLFAASVQPSGVRVRRSGEDLELHLAATSDCLVLTNWYTDDAYKVEAVEYADGTVWNVAYLLSLAPLLPIVGTQGEDELFSLGGVDNFLQGLAGDDVLVGSNSSDILDGGAGNDSLDGKYGSDTYLFNRGDGQDSISDYDLNP